MVSSHKHLKPEVIARVARLEIKARQIVEGFLSGGHRSPYFGQSVEFVQHREYVPGDDVRRIDWKVWSKTDKVYVKLYEEDTNLRTTLIVDLSESMRFGSKATTKYDYGCTIEQVSAFAGLHHFLARGLEGDHDRTLLSWPQGNAALCERMAARIELGDRLHTGTAVLRIDPSFPTSTC